MIIPQATEYGRCPKDAPVGLICDAGATAEDFYDSPLTQNVQVCGHPFFKNTKSNSFRVPILSACNITTRYPGTVTIKFSVTNSAGFTSRVERTLVVESVCLPGSRLCNNLVDCSVLGYTCESELAITDLGGRVEARGPIISLVTYPFLGGSIECGLVQTLTRLAWGEAIASAAVDLRAMSLVNRGLGGCAIDTLAPIGSIYQVAF
eukprot:gene22447-29562_t